MGWGYRIIVSVYMAGDTELPADDDFVRRISDAVSKEMPDSRFVGVRLEPVAHEPKDQGS